MSTENRRISLKVVAAPTGDSLEAPPVLMASDHTIEYLCGTCGVVLMHAEDHQVYNLVVHCTACGGYNATEV